MLYNLLKDGIYFTLSNSRIASPLPKVLSAASIEGFEYLKVILSDTCLYLGAILPKSSI